MNTDSKTTIHNLLILDESGSMHSIYHQALTGANETIQSIRAAQAQYADQDHRFTFVTFNTIAPNVKTVIDDAPIGVVKDLTDSDYSPNACTPLHDAIGLSVTALERKVKEGDKVLVTIITDGLENSSKEYTGSAVKKLVEELKGEGWTFTYMGANQNSVEIAFTLSIRNSRNFVASNEGISHGMGKDLSSRMNFFGRLADFKKEEQVSCCAMPAEERHACYSAMADAAFDEEEQNA